MTLDQAMHTTCEACGKDAGHHRLTDSGNFYCLIPRSWREAAITRSMDDEEARLYLQNRARCNDLQKSPITKSVAKVILQHIRGIGGGVQLSMSGIPDKG